MCCCELTAELTGWLVGWLVGPESKNIRLLSIRPSIFLLSRSKHHHSSRSRHAEISVSASCHHCLHLR